MENYLYSDNSTTVKVETELRKYNREAATSYRMVLQRECIEGLTITRRFRKAIFALLPMQNNGFNRILCHPIFDPFNTGIDQFPEEDEAAIERVLAANKFI